jgi:RNA polymerase sigma-70 factor (ECF subfamily)
MRPIGGSLGSASARTAAHRRLAAVGRVEIDRAYRLAGLLLGDAAEAEDATQETLLRAWRAAGSLRDPDGFDAWLDRILVNVCRDLMRRRRTVRWISLDPTIHDGATSDPFRSVLDRDSLLSAVRVLDADERVVIILHYWADLTLEAVGQRTGWPIGTVKSRLHRALERLRAAEPTTPIAGDESLQR